VINSDCFIVYALQEGMSDVGDESSECRAIVIKMFASEDKGYKFYNKYALEKGFSVRKNYVEWDGSNKEIVPRKLECCPCRYAPSATFTSRELLIASLLIAGPLVFYAPVVKIPPANTAVCVGGKDYPWRIPLLCADDNSHTAGASKQNAPGISPGGPTLDGPAPVHCYPRRID
jgi:zinc finger SWIM domain-containing protein 3